MKPGYAYAGFRLRLAAMALDFLIIAAYAVVLFAVASLLILTTSVEQRLDSALKRDLLAFSTLILPVVLYFALQESSTRQATPGKRKLGLKVITTGGGQLSSGQALLRSGIKFLPWQMAHTTVFQIYAGNTSPVLFAISILAQALVVVYLLSMMLSKQHRAPYDWFTGSAVIQITTGESASLDPPIFPEYSV